MNDPGVFGHPVPVAARPPELEALEERLSRAITLVNDLAAAHADTIRAKADAEKRGRDWSTIAYDMWSLLAKARYDGPPGAYARWIQDRNNLRARLFAMLDGKTEGPRQ